MFQLKTFSSFECRSMLSFHFLLTHHLLILYLGFAHFVPSLLHTLMMSQKFEIGKNGYLWIYLCTVKTILYKPNQTKPICLFIWIHSF